MTPRLVALLLLGPVAAVADAPPVEYHVAFEPEARAVAVRVCTAEAGDWRTFVPTHDDAPKYLLGSATRSSGGVVERSAEGFVVRDWRAGECLSYRADIGSIAARRDPEEGIRVGEDLLTSASLWLWRPRKLAREARAEIAFELPEGWTLSVPWASLDDAPHRRFEVGPTPGGWPTMVAIGHFKEEEHVAGLGRVRSAILGTYDEATLDKLRGFVLQSANDVAASLPQAFAVAPQLVLIPVPGRGASPFGLSVRGGGQGVIVLVNPAGEPAQFNRAWTLTHELVHVAHPHLGPEGRWISEGLATYYQNVLRARNGRLTAQETWDEIDAGFGRGRADKVDLTIGATSQEMDERGHYMRGYWSGAALMLRADLALRTRKDHPTSLDAVLNAYLACCRADARGSDVTEFLGALDRAAGGDTFMSLYRELVASREFPDVADAYRKLGIKSAPGHVERSSDPSAAALRKAIMGVD